MPHKSVQQHKLSPYMRIYDTQQQISAYNRMQIMYGCDDANSDIIVFGEVDIMLISHKVYMHNIISTLLYKCEQLTSAQNKHNTTQESDEYVYDTISEDQEQETETQTTLSSRQYETTMALTPLRAHNNNPTITETQKEHTIIIIQDQESITYNACTIKNMCHIL